MELELGVWILSLELDWTLTGLSLDNFLQLPILLTVSSGIFESTFSAQFVCELQLTLRDVLKLNLSVTLLTDAVVRLRAVLVGNRKESIDTWHICCIINFATYDEELGPQRKKNRNLQEIPVYESHHPS